MTKQIKPRFVLVFFAISEYAHEENSINSLLTFAQCTSVKDISPSRCFVLQNHCCLVTAVHEVSAQPKALIFTF